MTAVASPATHPPIPPATPPAGTYRTPGPTPPRPATHPTHPRLRRCPGLLVQRLLRLAVGLTLFGASIAMMIEAGLGAGAWDVLHQGMADRTGLSLGTVIIFTSAAVMAAWIPLRQRPGIGTVANVVVIGTAADATLRLLPNTGPLAARIAMLTGGVVLNGIASALYIGAGLGPGPRDGLMTGLARRGWPIRRSRTTIELSILTTGWLLGGTVGVGTVLYAWTIGPIIHTLLPPLTVKPAAIDPSTQPRR